MNLVVRSGRSADPADKPGAQQSVIAIGHDGLAQSDPDVLPIQVMNLPLGEIVRVDPDSL